MDKQAVDQLIKEFQKAAAEVRSPYGVATDKVKGMIRDEWKEKHKGQGEPSEEYIDKKLQEEQWKKRRDEIAGGIED